MNGPTVSVVMVVRNMERFLTDSIEGVLGQSFRDFEFLIVDFGSTDKSKQIVADYARSDGRIRTHEIPECTLAEARNAASALARGKYIAVQDADDVSLPNRLHAEVDFMERNPEMGFVGGIPDWVDESGKSIWVADFPTDEQQVKTALSTYFPFCHTSLLILKDAFDSVGGYRALFTQSHDYDLALRISERFRCTNVPDVVVKYRLHPYQVSLSKRNKQTLCKLAARVSAADRRAGRPDPLDDVSEITSPALAKIGISEAQQQSELASDYKSWIRFMDTSGQRDAAVKVTMEALRSKWQYLTNSEIAEFHFAAARLHWKDRHFVRCLIQMCYASLKNPRMLSRFAGTLRRRARVA
jgi:glycosyltransferase involved in cell wall biosynthesis